MRPLTRPKVPSNASKRNQLADKVLMPDYVYNGGMLMKSFNKVMCAAAAVLAVSATAASAEIVCNRDGDCWHVKTHHKYHPEFGLVIHPDNWRWHDHDKYCFARARRPRLLGSACGSNFDLSAAAARRAAATFWAVPVWAVPVRISPAWKVAPQRIEGLRSFPVPSAA